MSDRGRRRWQLAIQFLVIGYSVLGRSFAYIGLAPAKLFIGEIVMGWFFATRVRATERVILWARRTREARILRLAVGIFLLYGVMCIVHGYVLRRPTMPTLMNFAFNYYALYMIVGVAAALGGPNLLPVLARRLAWIHGIYGVLYIAGLQHIIVFMPGTEVGVFAQPNGSAFAVLAMLSYEPNVRRAIVPIILNLGVLAAVQVRAEWLGFVAAFAVWSVLAGKIRRFLILSALGLAFLIVGLVFDIRIPGLAGRGGEVSVHGIFGRILAPFDPDTAEKFVEGARDLGGTVDWRKRWWRGIWDSVNHEGDKQFFIGHGYGYDLTDLTDNVQEGVRTPHNVFFYALAYGGWAGAIVFAFLQVALGLCLWRVYRMNGDAFGLSYWVLCLALGLLGNTFETPFGAIPFYLTIGLVIAPLFQVPAPASPHTRPATPLIPSRAPLPWLVDSARR